MAHYLHSKMREGYYIEMATEKGKAGGDKKMAGHKLNDLMAAVGSGRRVPGIEVLKLPK